MTEPSAKAALRRRMLELRQQLRPEDRSALSRRIAGRVLELEAYRRARTLALYVPIGAEVDPSTLGEAARATGRRLVFPRVEPGGRVLAFATCDPEGLVAGPHGTQQPPDAAPPVPLRDIDLLLVPGVAFDERGGRLGRGGGYYDATLAGVCPPAKRVGLAFDAQVVPELPCEPHDVRVDVVVTEARVLFRLP